MTDKNENQEENGGNSWKIYVIKTLEKLDKRQNKIEDDHKKDELESAKDITEIKTKLKMSSAIISVIVGLIISIAVNVFSAYFISQGLEQKYEMKRNTKSQVEETTNKMK